MNTKPIVIFIILMTASLALSACSVAGTPAALSGTTWKLVSYGPATAPTPAVSGVDTHLTFDEQRRLQGNMGCNTFGGDFKLTGNQMLFGTMMSTMMACQGPVMDQEQAVLQVFNKSARFEISANRLTITSNDGSSTLTFAQAGK